MRDVWVALIAVGGSLLTGLLVAWSTFRVARAGWAEQRRRDLDNAMSDFLAALVKAVGFLRDMPHLDARHPIVAYARLSAKIGNRVSPGSSWVRAQRDLRRVLGEQPFLPAERVVDAAARLQVLAPAGDLAKAVDDALDYLAALGQDRSPAQLEKWSAVHEQVLDAIAATRRANEQLTTAVPRRNAPR